VKRPAVEIPGWALVVARKDDELARLRRLLAEADAARDQALADALRGSTEIERLQRRVAELEALVEAMREERSVVPFSKRR
jgi:hypothetical protein